MKLSAANCGRGAALLQDVLTLPVPNGTFGLSPLNLSALILQPFTNCYGTRRKSEFKKVYRTR